VDSPAAVVTLERLAKLAEALVTVSLGVLAPAVVQAVTSWWNRDTAQKQLEAERLRQLRDDDDA
jgi:hypothetical protein